MPEEAGVGGGTRSMRREPREEGLGVCKERAGYQASGRLTWAFHLCTSATELYLTAEQRAASLFLFPQARVVLV